MSLRVLAFATLLVASSLFFGGITEEASPIVQDVAAICGGGGFGEPCNCPHLGLPGKDPIVPINC